MVCLPSYNIDYPIYISWIESKLWQFYKRYPHLSPHLQIRPCLVQPYLPQPHCWAITKGSLWNNLAWWPLLAPSIHMPPPSPTTSHHHAPLLLSLSIIFLEHEATIAINVTNAPGIVLHVVWWNGLVNLVRANEHQMTTVSWTSDKPPPIGWYDSRSWNHEGQRICVCCNNSNWRSKGQK